MIIFFSFLFQVFDFVILCFLFKKFWTILNIWIYTPLVDRKYYSDKCKADYSFKHFCLCNFSRARVFIIFISWSVKLDCFTLSASVSDSIEKRGRSCQTPPNKFEKQASIYFSRSFFEIDASALLIFSK